MSFGEYASAPFAPTVTCTVVPACALTVEAARAARLKIVLEKCMLSTQIKWIGGGINVANWREF